MSNYEANVRPARLLLLYGGAYRLTQRRILRCGRQAFSCTMEQLLMTVTTTMMRACTAQKEGGRHVCASGVRGFRIRVSCPRLGFSVFAFSCNSRLALKSDRLDGERGEGRWKSHTVDRKKKQMTTVRRRWAHRPRHDITPQPI
jgi:hypothetical protein